MEVLKTYIVKVDNKFQTLYQTIDAFFITITGTNHQVGGDVVPVDIGFANRLIFESNQIKNELKKTLSDDTTLRCLRGYLALEKDRLGKEYVTHSKPINTVPFRPFQMTATLKSIRDVRLKMLKDQMDMLDSISSIISK